MVLRFGDKLGSRQFWFEPSELVRYSITLLAVRVAAVQGQLDSRYRTVCQRSLIPPYLYPLLRFVGKVSNAAIPTVYYPGLVWPSEHLPNADGVIPTLMGPDELELFRHHLIKLQAMGAEMTIGVPMSDDGTEGFMFSCIFGDRYTFTDLHSGVYQYWLGAVSYEGLNDHDVIKLANHVKRQTTEWEEAKVKQQPKSEDEKVKSSTETPKPSEDVIITDRETDFL
jgi:hypothetical protein